MEQRRRLTDIQVRRRIRALCREQDEVDLCMAQEIEERILGLCEALGADQEGILGQGLLESVGITVKKVNPRWVFGEEEE